MTRWPSGQAGGGRESHRLKCHMAQGWNPALPHDLGQARRPLCASIFFFLKDSSAAFLTAAHLSERPNPSTLTPSAGEDTEQRQPRPRLVSAAWCGHRGQRFGSCSPNHTHSPHTIQQPRSFVSTCVSRKRMSTQSTFTQVFSANLLITAKPWKHQGCPLVGE